MSNHFTAMGLPVREREDMSRVIMTALRGAAVEPVGGRQTVAVWREGAGNGVDVLLRNARWRGEPSVECATPQFDGASRQRVRVTGMADDGDCAGCALVTVEVLDGDELAYPLVVAPARVVAMRRRFEDLAKTGAPVEASLVFVAEEIEVYADEAAFAAVQDSLAAQDAREGIPGFAAESVIPAGLFGEGPPAAAALVHGVVTAARRICSAAFDENFLHLTVRTFGGEFDVVAAEETTVAAETTVSAGNVVAVQAWVCGQIGQVSPRDGG